MGRVSRKLGLIDAAARTDATAAPLACALCDRPLGSRVEWHHVVPKSEGGTETQPVHPICHRTIHAAADNATLARIGELGGVRAIPAVARFLGWIADKPPDFHAPTRRTRAT
ncbi:HNH endonuclease [Sphingomonas sp. NBWT7]|uniref:HNH endonuclease n=1 Tax=Sphingomonas sp. NBWT7 TaxID=2596913 RepID=UPI001626FA65|nr:HNH endonuclease [Sphingomonas sp. NBWT7]QNE31738.1 HNH endonuclease [Sphingomonas sp. NBWT7]